MFDCTNRGKRFSLVSDEPVFTWTIGRNEFAEIEISSESTSRMHASITKMEAIYEITEDQATNGLIINGNTTSKAILHHGDTIQLGNVTLLYRNDDQTEQLGWQKKLVGRFKNLINAYKRSR